MREGDRLQRVITCLHFVETGIDAPGTQFIDTVALHAHLLKSGFYANLGYTEDDLRDISGQFTEEHYRDSSLVQYDKLTGYENTQEITALRDSIIDTSTYDSRPTPLIVDYPEGSAVVFDHERCEGLYDANNNRHDQLLTFLRLATANEAVAELSATGILHEIEPETGMIIIFERPRAMHRSLPGNNARRIIQLGWASEHRVTL
jgi:hypothetical protein